MNEKQKKCNNTDTESNQESDSLSDLNINCWNNDYDDNQINEIIGSSFIEGIDEIEQQDNQNILKKLVNWFKIK